MLHVKSEKPGKAHPRPVPLYFTKRRKSERLITGVREYARNYFLKILFKNIKYSTKKVLSNVELLALKVLENIFYEYLVRGRPTRTILKLHWDRGWYCKFFN